MNNDTDKEDLLGALFPRMGWGGGGGEQGSMHFTTINTRTKTRQKLDDFLK